jgi:hypothetical protein
LNHNIPADSVSRNRKSDPLPHFFATNMESIVRTSRELGGEYLANKNDDWVIQTKIKHIQCRVYHRHQ